MGRMRVVAAVVAGLVGVTAIALGVRISTRDSHATLATENSVIPAADEPRRTGRANDAVTETTFDLGVLAPLKTDVASASTTTPTTTPQATTTSLPKGYARVHVTNSSAWATVVSLADQTQNVKVLPPGDSVDWIVRTSPTGTDSGSARIEGTNCGPAWGGADDIVAGREYHLEVKASVGYCANGQPMPMVLLTDYTVGGSKLFTGLVPDPSHALIYVRNQYGAPVRVRINDGDEIEWTIDPTVWGAPQLLTTASDHGDGATVARIDDSSCGRGDAEDYFLAGHTYRIDVVDGSGSCGAAKAPTLKISDLTTRTSVVLG